MTVNFSADSSARSAPRAPETPADHSSGTTMTIQGGVSSTMSPNRLAVLLAGMLGKTAPRRIMTERNL